MSNEALTWAFKQDLPMAQKFVLVALADHADHAHSCFPSHAYTAKRVGASPRTVQRAVHELAQAGYIWVRSETRKNGSQTSNRYVLKVTTEHFDRGDRESRGGDRESPLGVTTNTPGGVPPVSPPEPSLEPSEEPATASRKQRARRIPDSWEPNDTHQAKANEKNLDLAHEAETFRNHAQAHDRRLVDWDAGFRNWLTKAKPRPPQGRRNDSWMNLSSSAL